MQNGTIKPDYEEYYNGVKVYVWGNNGNPRIKLNRKIKGKDSGYRYVDYFRPEDIPNVYGALAKAQEYLSAQYPAQVNTEAEINT